MHPRHLILAVILLAVAVKPLLSQTFTVLHTFNGSDGEYPAAPLLVGADGNLYGTTQYGSTGYGTVFKLDKAGNYSVLYSFAGSPEDGAYPVGGLMRDPAGNLYGVTWQGGATNGGTVFRLDTSGKETVLYSFVLNSADGMWPLARPIEDSEGNMYGTTSAGGVYGGGTIFELETSGEERILFNFGNGGGAYPEGGALLRVTKYLVGTTSFGGSSNLGTVFTFDGSKAVTVVDFGGAEGEFPYAGLVRNQAGNLFGTTQFGGDMTCHAESSGCGTVFQVSPAGVETVLYSFLGSPDGDDVVAGLALDNSGNIFGVTAHGGNGACEFSPYQGCGTVFEISSGKETILYNFTGGADGKYPYGGLALDSENNLYGTSAAGGGSGCNGNGCGTIFKIAP